MMTKSPDYCKFDVTWDCSHDLDFLTSYTVVQSEDVNNWFQEYNSECNISCNGSASSSCTRPAGHTEAMELCCACKPHYSVCFLGALVVSEARILECYTQMDGYLNSFRGKEIDKGENGDGEDNDKKFYRTFVMFDGRLKSFSLKFLGLGEKTQFTIARLELILTMDEDRGTSSHVGSIDMSKVKSYLHSMGNNTPAGAMDLFQSVEQFQKTQGMGLGALSAMFTPQTAGQSSNRLTGLLAMMTSAKGMSSSCDSGIANDNSAQRPCDSDSTSDINAQRPCDSELANQMRDTPAPPSMPGSLQTLMMSMLGSKSTDSSQDESQDLDKDSMYSMLKGICGRVSELRVDESKELADSDKQDSEEPNSEPNASVPVLSGNMTVNAMKSVFEQTATELIQQSEERLKDYIDTRLDAMENRLYNKLDCMMKALQKNGHPHDLS